MEQSNAARVIITIIPIVGIVMGAVVVFFYLLWNHRRQMALIKSGQWTKTRLNLGTFSLLTGLLLTCVGAALTVFFSLLRGTDYVLLGGLIPLSLGIALLIFYRMNKKHDIENQGI
jgi:hypothetical protein